jgi:hypothetical protein
MQLWPPMMMTRMEPPLVVAMLAMVVAAFNANDSGGGDGGGGSDRYRTAFATHSAVSVLPVNGTRVVFSLPFASRAIPRRNIGSLPGGPLEASPH